MYSQIDIGILQTNDDETYEFIFNSSNYVCPDIKKKIVSSEHNLYNMPINNELNPENIEYEKSNYKIRININKYTGDDVKFLKNLNDYIYDIYLIKYNFIKNKYKLIGITYNNNTYYVYNKKKNIENYKTINNKIDKLTISEIVIKSFEYYFKCKCKYNNNSNNFYLLDIYDNNYKKRIINYNIENPIQYMNLYQSLILKFEIYNYNLSSIQNNMSCTFLPVNKKSYSNLFYIYQIVFKVLDSSNNSNIKTFTNPKNELYFGNNYKIIPTKYKLKLRLFVSKLKIYDTLYYRKTTEKNNYNINILLYEKTNKIIGFEFCNTKYFIWKNNGDLKTYETYNLNNNYLELIVNTLKDALIFLFKIY